MDNIEYKAFDFFKETEIAQPDIERNHLFNLANEQKEHYIAGMKAMCELRQLKERAKQLEIAIQKSFKNIQDMDKVLIEQGFSDFIMIKKEKVE